MSGAVESRSTTVCPNVIDPLFIVTYNIEWVKTSWVYCRDDTKHLDMMYINVSAFLGTILTFIFNLNIARNFTDEIVAYNMKFAHLKKN